MLQFKQAENLNDWSSGICECCGPDGNWCCFGCCCGGCCPSLGQAILLQELGLQENLCLPVLCYHVLGYFGNVPTVLIATNLRYGIVKKREYAESPCCSFCYSCCCMPCSFAQIQRDYQKRHYRFEKRAGAESDTSCCCCNSYIQFFEPIFGTIGSNMHMKTIPPKPPNNMQIEE